MTIKKLGIVVGGGPAPGTNGVIAAVAIAPLPPPTAATAAGALVWPLVTWEGGALPYTVTASTR